MAVGIGHRHNARLLTPFGQERSHRSRCDAGQALTQVSKANEREAMPPGLFRSRRSDIRRPLALLPTAANPTHVYIGIHLVTDGLIQINALLKEMYSMSPEVSEKRSG